MGTSFKDKYSPDYIREHLFVPDVPVKTKFGIVHGGKGSSAEMARLAAGVCLEGEVDTLVFTGGLKVCDPLTLAGIFKFNSDYFFKGDSFAEKFAHAAKRGYEFAPFKAGRELFMYEAELMREVALAEGVDPEKILTEGIDFGQKPYSRHAGENAEAILSNTRLRGEIFDSGAVTMIGVVYDTRRKCGVMAKKLDGIDGGENVIVVPRSLYPYGFTPDNWPESDDIRERIVYTEMAKIDPENSQSHIYTTRDYAPYDVEGHREMAFKRLEKIDLSPQF